MADGVIPFSNGGPTLVLDIIDDQEEVPWTHHQKLIDPDYFERLYPTLNDTCQTYSVTIYGKTFPSKRKTCIYTQFREKRDKDYHSVPVYLAEEAPAELIDIWNMLQDKLKLRLDYVLVHIYRDHDDYIGWHNDKEALDSDIVSVSLGATRRFQFRPLTDKKGFQYEYFLRNGDVVHMKGSTDREKGCQRRYKHCLPVMTCGDMKAHLTEHNISLNEIGRVTKVKLLDVMDKHNLTPVRINLTFRQY